MSADSPFDGEYVPSTAQWVADQVEEYERSGGTEGTQMHGYPTVVLTTLGAKSGVVRKSPVMRVSDGERYAVVASLGGAPDNPSWYGNLRAHPRVRLQDGPAVREYTARVAEGAERSEWWQRAVDAFPPYAEYQEKTDRVIPVVVLEPVGG
ncbi:nitroreductase family deazaflavin-dependent oxidoreductase [Streptomyces xiaopingdaonensis]|uniref:nitroreductase family deazaflavin-dependent oxidoreductase n=1 Tax=Streptomyces xiaopingdaonensis TaxID=1565415 RepID=UPI000376E34D|nr:nitroreductase family deazaflavin-dependent oxidoreductase [Streptomyces xiaopingdaonensis]